MTHNIPAILLQLGIDYKYQNRSYIFECINPSHSDENPSMRMNDEGLYHCFVCGAGGNLHTFIKELTGESLYDFLDIEDPMSYEFKAKLAAEKRAMRSFSKKSEEKKLYQDSTLYPPHANKEVMEYLASINMNTEFMRFFHVTYTLHTTFAFIKTKEPTHFYNRICIPVYENKKLINMIGRDFTEKQTPKELYPKGSITDTFFNIDNIDFDKPVIIVEGMKGLIRIWQHFNRNVMSSFGSALGQRQLAIISKIKNLLLFCDHDKAGWQMADKVYEARPRDFSLTAMRKEGDDPADGSLEDLGYAMRHPIASVDYYLKRHGKKLDKTLRW